MPVGGLTRQFGCARLFALALLGLAEVAVGAIATTATVQPASAQFLDDRFPFMDDRVRRNRQYQQWNQPSNPYGYGDQPQRQAPVESSRAPAPRKPDVPPTTNVLVFGDAMSEWLSYGLEEAFAETPEIGVTRKPRANSGLIRTEQRGESYDWPTAAKEIITAEKPDFIVMMLGTADRRGIREAIRQQPARTPAGQKKDASPATQPGQQAGATPPPQAAPAKPIDTEAPPDAAQDDQPPSITAPEGSVAGTVVHEFRSEKWGELYAKRVDEMIGVLKAKGVPVFWVGLPSVRGARATSEMVYLNDLYRGRAEKAGITYIDVWDGFVDEGGNYNNYGPDFEGQTRRLRSGDGANFTRAGARKLAHYVEREIRRVMLARATPATAPLPQEPEPDAKAPPAAAAPGLPPRPIASPVMSLTAPKGAGDALLGGAPVRNSTADSVATRVLVKGEPIEAPPGRADDFAWPRRDVVTATGVLPPDPVEPEPEAATAAANPSGTEQRPRSVVRRPTEQQRAAESGSRWGQPPQQQQQSFWGGGWGQRQQQPPQRSGGFFGGFFGGRW
jgi:hypothetical protein